MHKCPIFLIITPEQWGRLRKETPAPPGQDSSLCDLDKYEVILDPVYSYLIDSRRSRLHPVNAL